MAGANTRSVLDIHSLFVPLCHLLSESTSIYQIKRSISGFSIYLWRNSPATLLAGKETLMDLSKSFNPPLGFHAPHLVFSLAIISNANYWVNRAKPVLVLAGKQGFSVGGPGLELSPNFPAKLFIG